MNSSDAEPTIASAEATRLTYLIRRTALVVAVIAIAGAVAAAATGRLDALEFERLSLGSGADAITVTDQPPTGEPASATTVTTAVTPRAPADDQQDPVGLTITVDDGASEEAVTPSSQALVPARASRLIAQAPARLLDTRSPNGAEAPPPSPETTHTIVVPDGRTAAALSVSLMAPERSGSVVIDGKAGAVEAVAVGGPGTTVTNLVIVPIVGTELTVRSSAGGHIVIDLVGSFEPAPDGSGAGRFVSIDPTRITELETALDGREATLTFQPAVPQDGVSALLAIVTADVGSDGGVVRLGPAPDAFNQMLMWGPAPEDNRQRRGLALIEPGNDGASALVYNGGSALTVDVIGYFTDGDADLAVDGLYVPSGPRLLFSGQLGPDRPATLTGVEPETGIGVATVASRSADAGRLWSITAPVDNGSVQVSASASLEADVTLLGVFIG